jgi:hypothetical protein
MRIPGGGVLDDRNQEHGADHKGHNQRQQLAGEFAALPNSARLVP